MVIHPSIGFNIPIVLIPKIGWMTIARIPCFDDGTYGGFRFVMRPPVVIQSSWMTMTSWLSVETHGDDWGYPISRNHHMPVWNGSMRWEYTLSEYDIVYIIHYILYIHNNIRTWICPWRRYPLKLWRFTVEKWPAKAMGRQFTRLRHPKHLSVSTCQDFLLKNAVRIWCNTKWFTQFPVFHIQLHNYI